MKFSNLVIISSALLSSAVNAAPQLGRGFAKRQAITSTATVDVTVTVTVTGSSGAATAAQASTPSAAQATSSSAAVASSNSGSNGNFSPAVPCQQFVAPTVEFQDGTIDCSSFPSNQPGVVARNDLGFGGWTGIQIGESAGQSCVEGAYCSYACQPGMSKTQWPANQPSDGETRGGLICQGGKLYRTSTSSNTLCSWGASSGFVSSSLSNSVAICRTDYPGSENMVIPTFIGPGAQQPLSVVDEDSYFSWEGKKTSSQYYVNNAGVSVEDGCIWSTAGSNKGNWAPMVFGAGYTNGLSYLSLFPNPLANGAALNYNVRIVASAGSTINGDCSYVNGQYSGGSNGCTVTVTSGSAVFELF